jgi:hypothetical protein
VILLDVLEGVLPLLERPSRPRHQHQAELEPEVDEDEPLHLEPL